MINGSWVVDSPHGYELVLGGRESFASLDDIFDGARFNSHRRGCYEAYIVGALERLYKEGHKFGALVIEPVILGSGGMFLCDPLFQNTLVKAVRKSPHLFSGTALSPILEDEHDWTGLPVIFDEVFTGFNRLGRFTSASLLTVHPDITANVEHPTGGLLPLSTSMASRSIFDAFKINKKRDALLDGQSYTAHAIGRQAAVNNIQSLIQKSKQQLAQSAIRNATFQEISSKIGGKVWSVWSPEFVKEISKRTEKVEWAWALGSVLAISIKNEASSSKGSSSNVLVIIQLTSSFYSWLCSVSCTGFAA